MEKVKKFFAKTSSSLKKFFVGIGRWFATHVPSKRRIIQLYAAVLYNANIKGYISGQIFTGSSKAACVPGLNCYSCPGAVGACPLGSLQNAIGSAGKSVPYYMLGILALYGLILGRTICGFLCPVGLAQELLYKIKTPKLKKSKFTYILTFLKVAIFAVFIIALPLGFGLNGYANPGFCKYFCPAGTFEGGFFLLMNPNNDGLYQMLGNLFTWKTLVLAIFVIASVFIYRFFCRFFCPLGLIYGIFNYFSILGVTVNKSKCTNCGLCVNACKMDIRKVGDHECIQCGECISVCPEQAITWKGSKIFLHKNQLEPVESNIKIDLTSSLPKIDNNVVTATNVEEKVEVKPVEKVKKEKAPLYDKKKTKIFFISLFSALSVATATALIYYNFVEKEPVTGDFAVGVKMESFTVDLYDNGKDETFTLKLTDKVTVINFWATWCGPCVKELPEFEELYHEYSDQVQMIAIHQYEETEDVQAYINKAFPDYKIMFGRDNEGDKVFKSVGGKNTLPYTVILDKRNVCTYIKNGSIKYEELKGYIDSTLANLA